MAALARAASEPEEGTGFERGRGHEAPRESDGARRLGGQAPEAAQFCVRCLRDGSVSSELIA